MSQRARKTITLAGRDYTFTFSINVMCEIEDRSFKPFVEVCEGFDKGSVSTLRLFVKEMCANPVLSLEQAGELLDEHKDAIQAVLLELISLGTQGPNESGPEVEAEATASLGTGNKPDATPSGHSL